MSLGRVQFQIKGLNQEKILNKLSKKYNIYNILRLEKQISVLEVSFFIANKFKKSITESGLEVIAKKSIGILPYLLSIFSSVGFLLGLALSFVLLAIQTPFVFQYEIVGNESLSKTEIVGFLKSAIHTPKTDISTEFIEDILYEKFDEISFVSVIVKGKTLVVNIKEKLLPDEIYGDFTPIFSNYDGKVLEINVVSGISAVDVGDYVFKGDLLVKPYYIDAEGKKHNIQTKATVKLETYTIGTSTFCEEKIVTERTGNMIVQNGISLFGLNLYKHGEENNYAMYEVVEDVTTFSKNLILPLRFTKRCIYELKQEIVKATYEEKEEEIVDDARKNALENSANYDTIKNEFYTVKHSCGISVVSYVIVGEKVVANES